jgi:hypothetical protein
MILSAIFEILSCNLRQSQSFYDFISHSPEHVSYFTTVLIHFTKSSVIIRFCQPFCKILSERVGGNSGEGRAGARAQLDRGLVARARLDRARGTRVLGGSVGWVDRWV